MHADDLMAGAAAHWPQADSDGPLDHAVRPLDARQRRHSAVRLQPPGHQLRTQVGILTQHTDRGFTLLRARQRLADARPDNRRRVLIQRRLDQQCPLSAIVIDRSPHPIRWLGLTAGIDRLQTNNLCLRAAQRRPHRGPIHRPASRPRQCCLARTPRLNRHLQLPGHAPILQPTNESGQPRSRPSRRCRPALVMSCRARTRHTYDGTRRGGRMT